MEECHLMACSLSASFDAHQFAVFTRIVFQLMWEGRLSPDDLERLEEACGGKSDPDRRISFDGNLMHDDDLTDHPFMLANSLPGNVNEMRRMELLAKEREWERRKISLPDEVRRVAVLEDQLRVRFSVPFVSDAIAMQIREGILSFRMTYGEVLRSILVQLQVPVVPQRQHNESLISA
jgi:hypothetical protein